MKEKILKLLLHPLSKTLGTIIIFAAGILMWMFPNTPAKSIKVGLVANVEPIKILEGVRKDDISIFYREKKLTNLLYLKIKFENNGGIPIIRADFVENITLALPGDYSIIDFKVGPSNLLNVQLINPNSLAINSDLLNPKDVETIEVLIDANKKSFTNDDLSMEGRINGISKLKLEDYKEEDFITNSEQKNLARKNIIALVKFMGLMLIFLLILYFLGNLIEYKGTNRGRILLSKIVSYILGICIGVIIVGGIGMLLYELIKTVITAI